MIKYKYTIDNQSIETLDLNDIPQGVEYETIEYEQEVEVIPVPQFISQMKLRLQLIVSGVSIASIYAMIDSIPDPIQREMIYAKWEYAVLFDRTDVTLNQMAVMLGISSEQLDAIFTEGNKL